MNLSINHLRKTESRKLFEQLLSFTPFYLRNYSEKSHKLVFSVEGESVNGVSIIDQNSFVIVAFIVGLSDSGLLVRTPFATNSILFPISIEDISLLPFASL